MQSKPEQSHVGRVLPTPCQAEQSKTEQSKATPCKTSILAWLSNTGDCWEQAEDEWGSFTYLAESPTAELDHNDIAEQLFEASQVSPGQDKAQYSPGYTVQNETVKATLCGYRDVQNKLIATNLRNVDSHVNKQNEWMLVMHEALGKTTHVQALAMRFASQDLLRVALKRVIASATCHLDMLKERAKAARASTLAPDEGDKA